VPFKPVAEALEKRHSEAEEKKGAKPPVLPSDTPRGNADAAELRRKIEALEARIDLMARELGRLGKILSEKEDSPKK